MGTADDPHQQATLLRVVAQRHQDSATLGEKSKEKKRASTDARSCPDEHPANRQHLMKKTVIKRSVIGILFLFFLQQLGHLTIAIIELSESGRITFLPSSRLSHKPA